MKLRNILLISATLPLLGACVAYDEGYGYNGGYAGGPAYYGAPGYYNDAYPTSTYIEFNQSYTRRGGYRENYWSHDRAREEHWHNDRPAPRAPAAPVDHRNDHHDNGDHDGDHHH